MHQTIKIFLIALILPTLILAGDLFFSEYIEGSSNNKAVEIYNSTGTIVDLTNYRIVRSNNGATVVQDSIVLSGTLNDKSVYVVGNPSAASAILSVSNTTHTITYFNGDDYLGLQKLISGTWTTIDVLGQFGEDPGTAWSVAGVTDAMAEHTLVRKPTVSQGNTDWTSSAGTSADDSEWEVHPQNTFTYLGSHVWSGGGNVSPMARAGLDRVERFNVTVTLDGSISNDPDGSIVSYTWTQISGTSVTLSATDQAIVTFTSPSSVETLMFELVVTDNESAIGKDSVTIYVDPSPIIISEYVEGTSNNKYIEIFNASNELINLTNNGYELRTSFNGANNFSSSFSDWGSRASIPAGSVIVLANAQAAIYPSPDILVPSSLSSPLNFNGNDAVALFRNGLIVDIIGEPTKIDTILDNRTMRRNSTITFGSYTYIESEWIEFGTDNVENLGSHNTNPNAPLVSDITVSPDFITLEDEITVSATITPVVGSITSATIYYGAPGSLINTAVMWKETGDTCWMGNIPPQTGNSIIEFYIYCKDDQSPANSGKSATQTLIIANSTPETIANVHTNIESLNGKIVTIRGIVTIGAGVLANDYTSAYIQDASGRGLNLYKSGKLYSDITRGDELMVVGYVEKFFTTIEVTNFIYKKISSGNELPPAQVVTVAGANSSDWEGTLIEFSGMVTKQETSDEATNISVSAGTDTTIARIPDATGIDVASITLGNSYKFRGVGNKYKSTYQTLIGYAEDIVPLTAIKESKTNALTFKLNPAYPNPFNPATTISWQLDKNGAYEVVVFNVLGQKIDVIASGYATAGSYAKIWNAAKFPSGVYFVQLQAGNRVRTQKMLYLK
ncbi:MAG TPA: lamin tail domain-containing protein [Candidatus Marinimicrobia bacterium]|nr:lamin tail domain-containing protein [Candidatus Neomarinimicrobiota bacterium]HQK11729.1 lamin tail domain-containing protein [Candidatus Neomarinimicrobiota bacterium]